MVNSGLNKRVPPVPVIFPAGGVLIGPSVPQLPRVRRLAVSAAYPLYGDPDAAERGWALADQVTVSAFAAGAGH